MQQRHTRNRRCAPTEGNGRPRSAPDYGLSKGRSTQSFWQRAATSAVAYRRRCPGAPLSTNRRQEALNYYTNTILSQRSPFANPLVFLTIAPRYLQCQHLGQPYEHRFRGSQYRCYSPNTFGGAPDVVRARPTDRLLLTSSVSRRQEASQALRRRSASNPHPSALSPSLAKEDR